MVASLILIKKIAQLFLIMIMGFTIVRTKLLKSEDSRILSILLIYLITPCVIINSFQIDFNQEILNKLVFSFVLAIIVHAILIFFTILLNKVKKLDVVEKTNIIYTNAGVLVIPLVSVLLGEEYVVYSCAFIIVQLILLWTHCKIMLCPSQAIDWRKFIYDINIISILIGGALFIFHLTLPSVIKNTFTATGSMLGPVGMLLAGMIIADKPILKIFTTLKNFFPVVIRMIVYPVLILLIFKATNISAMIPDGKNILMITYLAAIAPACATVTSMAQLYKKDMIYSSELYVLTTIFSIITMPVLIGFYNKCI